jgi:hypothetical protein
LELVLRAGRGPCPFFKIKNRFMHFQYWFNYFKDNQIHFDHIDWSADDKLTEKEKQLITSSIQKFQMGEHSEGKHFLAFANSKDFY